MPERCCDIRDRLSRQTVGAPKRGKLVLRGVRFYVIALRPLDGIPANQAWNGDERPAFGESAPSLAQNAAARSGGVSRHPPTPVRFRDKNKGGWPIPPRFWRWNSLFGRRTVHAWAVERPEVAG